MVAATPSCASPGSDPAAILKTAARARWKSSESSADNGRIALAQLDRGVTRLAIGRVVDGAFGLTAFADAAVAILPGFERPRSFTF